MADWDDLRFVLEAARAGGLAGAARALGTSHATVSRRIAACEARLGARLFDRLPSGLSPTEAGREAVRAAEAMEDQALALSRAAAGLDRALSGPLRVAVPSLMVGPVLARPLAAFRAAHPQVELTLLASDALANLHRREADVALRGVSVGPGDGLWGGRIAPLLRRTYAAPRWVAAAQEGAPVDWIAFTHWTVPPDAPPGARIALRVDDMTAALGACRAGLGALRMPCFLGESDPILRPLPGSPPERFLELWALSLPELSGLARVRRFIRAMRAGARAELARLQPPAG